MLNRIPGGPVQDPIKHDLHRFSTRMNPPGQACPLQDLVRFCIPVPHVTLQADHGVHSVQTASEGNESLT